MLIKTKFNVGEDVYYLNGKFVITKIEITANDFDLYEIRYDIIRDDMICKSILEENLKKVIRKKSGFECW